TIPDLGTRVASLTVDQDLTISDVNVQLNLTHGNDADLVIRLKGPDGTTVLLVNRRGGSADNFKDTRLDDEAAQPIAKGRAPFTASFRSEEHTSELQSPDQLGCR